MWNKVTLKYNNTKKHRGLQEDEGLIFFYMKKRVYKQHISIYILSLFVG